MKDGLYPFTGDIVSTHDGGFEEYSVAARSIDLLPGFFHCLRTAIAITSAKFHPSTLHVTYIRKCTEYYSSNVYMYMGPGDEASTCTYRCQSSYPGSGWKAV